MGSPRLVAPLQKITLYFQSICSEFLSEMGPYWARRPLLWVLPALTILILSTHSFWKSPPQGPHALNHFNGTSVRLTGLIRDFPDQRDRGTVLVVEAETLRPTGRFQAETAVHGRAWIFSFGTDPGTLAPGDRVQIWGRLALPDQNSLPGTFNFRKFLANRQIHSVMFTSSSAIKNLGPSHTLSLRRQSWKLHRFIQNAFESRLTPENASVLSGLALGNRPRRFPEIKRDFVRTGTMHILVASGSNIAFVVGFWFLFVRLFFRMPKSAALATGLIPVWIYVFMVGADPPILRAGIMGTVGVLAFLFGREDRPIHALFLAGTVMLLLEPRTLFEVGFLMSFASVFGIVYWLPKFEPWVAERNASLRWLLRIILATFTAQVWLFPIMAATFHRVHPIGLLANIIIVPLAAGGFLSGVILGAAEWISQFLISIPILDLVINGLSNFYLNLILTTVHFLGRHAGISIWVSTPRPMFILGFYFLLLTLPNLNRRWGRFATIVAASFLILFLFIHRTRPPTSTKFRWIDTGRQTNLIIQTIKGRTLLVDPLPHTDAEKINQSIRSFFADSKINSIDVLILSKPRAQMEARIAALQESMPINRIWDPLPGAAALHMDDVQIKPYFASRGFGAQRAFAIRSGNSHILAGYIIPLTIQRELVKTEALPFEVIQARFSEKILWDKAFLRKFKPDVAVEMGMGSTARPSVPPWTEIKRIIPQKLHDWHWPR